MNLPAICSLRAFLQSLAILVSGHLAVATIGSGQAAATSKPSLSPNYRTLDEIESELERLSNEFPEILHREDIGRSSWLNLPIWAVKISDNAAQREDEPRILFAGVHHAREPIGANICLRLIESLCRGYLADSRIRNWVDNIEIWFVPVVNPDGYDYIFGNNLGFPWWRKNLRDNNGDNRFDPLVDGVDLNRNYDYNWQQGGDNKGGSWFYRGTNAFSEKETQAIMELALRENFVMGVSYHSYGESILYPWGNFKSPPDLQLIMEIAAGMASVIGRETGRGHYSILPLNGRVGQSSIWMYGKLRTIDFIVEVGTSYFPKEEHIPQILKENEKGVFYLLERLLSTGIKGHVYDATTHEPLLAEVEVEEFSANYVEPRRTNGELGSFYCLVGPGRFSLRVSSRGYRTKRISDVTVQAEEFVELDIELKRETPLTNGQNQGRK